MMRPSLDIEHFDWAEEALSSWEEEQEVLALQQLEEKGERERFRRLFQSNVVQELQSGFMFDCFVATRKQSIEAELEELGKQPGTPEEKIEEIANLHRQYEAWNGGC